MNNGNQTTKGRMDQNRSATSHKFHQQQFDQQHFKHRIQPTTYSFHMVQQPNGQTQQPTRGTHFNNTGHEEDQSASHNQYAFTNNAGLDLDVNHRGMALHYSNNTIEWSANNSKDMFEVPRRWLAGTRKTI
jgi:hypothetical protein